jgi:hypothetical protein
VVTGMGPEQGEKMTTEIEESRQQALVSLLKTASEQGVDVTELVRATEQHVSKHTAEPYSAQITKQIRIAHALAAGAIAGAPASNPSA